MGQLERYGLYVLCLVIFLILGVAIWGGDPQAASAGNANLTQELEQASSPIASEQVELLSVGDSLTVSQLLDLHTGPPLRDIRASIPEPVVDETPPPAPKSAPARSVETETRYYVVQDGDMLEEIARRQLGRRDRWREIEALNPGVEERKLKLGTRLRLPPKGTDSGGSVQGWFLYTVRQNDNPSKISQRLYGTQAFAEAILDLNPGLNELKLKPGSEIRVPLRK